MKFPHAEGNLENGKTYSFFTTGKKKWNKKNKKKKTEVMNKQSSWMVTGKWEEVQKDRKENKFVERIFREGIKSSIQEEEALQSKEKVWEMDTMTSLSKKAKVH